MKRSALSVLFALFLPGLALAQQPAAVKPPQPGPAARPVNPVTNELATRGIAAAQKEQYEEALNLFREAYRTDKNPRWLYDMGVLYDRMANCDDAAFFYRAALFGKGVLPQDQEAVDNRLGVLQDECKYKERHKLVSDRHDRASRYADVKLCALAEDILTGIITSAERQKIEACKAEIAKTQQK